MHFFNILVDKKWWGNCPTSPTYSDPLASIASKMLTFGDRQTSCIVLKCYATDFCLQNICNNSIVHREALVCPIKTKFSGLGEKRLGNLLTTSRCVALLVPPQQLHIFGGLIKKKIVNSLYTL